MTYPIPDPPLPKPGPCACPQCGETSCAGEQRWQHERDYRASEVTWMREARGPVYAFRDGAWEVTR